jgi:3-phytase
VIRASRVRSFGVGSTAEGCVADHELGWLYVGEEDVGIWRYGAEPGAGEARTLVARVGENGLAADVEGLTIYYAAGLRGYLIASSQGASTLAIYRRDGSNAFVMTIDPAPGAISKPGETDGIDVTNVATSPRFPHGLFVCQDGRPGREGRQSFKFFA